MRCPTHEDLLHLHLRHFGNMRCAPTWADALHHQRLAEAAAHAAGAHILRVHDVSAHRAAVDLADKLLATPPPA